MITRVEHHETPEHGDGGVPSSAEQLGGTEVHEPLRARRGRGARRRQLGEMASQQPGGEIELEVLVGAHPRNEEAVGRLGRCAARHGAERPRDQAQPGDETPAPHGLSSCRTMSVMRRS